MYREGESEVKGRYVYISIYIPMHIYIRIERKSIYGETRERIYIKRERESQVTEQYIYIYIFVQIHIHMYIHRERESI